MNYFHLSEAEYYRLDAVHGQLNLVAGLLTAKGADQAHYDASNLHDFLAAQTDSLKPILVAVSERYDSEREQAKREEVAPPMVIAQAIEPGLLIDMIHAASGVDIGQEKMIAIADRLMDFCIEGHNYGSVIKAYYAAMQNAGWDIMTTTRNGESSTEFQARASSPEPAPTAPAKKPALRKRDKLVVKSLEVV